MKNQVVILDFGSQHTQLIARWVREEKVYCQVIPGDAKVQEIKNAVDPVSGDVPAAIILSDGPGGAGLQVDTLSGGPGGSGRPVDILPDKAIFGLGIPVLAIGYGKHAMAQVLRQTSGESAGQPGESSEAGESAGLPGESSETRENSGLPGESSETRENSGLPGESSETGENSGRPGQGGAGPGESGEIAAGIRLDREELRNFLFNVAKMKADWSPVDFVRNSIAEIRRVVGNGHVISGVSGGVDSTVCAAIVHEAVGDNLHCILVDHGLLRKDEARQVVDALSRLGVKLTLVNAQDRFLAALKGVTDPEKKRKIIGEMFITVFEEEAAKFGDAQYFLQGTIYPDVIESGSKLRPVVKSHHNVGGLPDRMRLKLLEPVRELFKDEVRQVGRAMGLPAELVDRHPFPGPGLAVRVLGEVTKDKLDILRDSQAILDEEIRAAGLYGQLWQGFCVIPDVRTVGVKDGVRTYGNLVAIRAVRSEDAMTAEWAKLPYVVLDKVSSRIVNEVGDVNRVVFDITSKPPSTIEWE